MKKRTYGGMSPIFDQLVNVMTRSEHEEVSPFVVADVKTAVLVHPVGGELKN